MEVVEERRQPADSLWAIVRRRLHIRIIFRDQDRGFHSFHGDVLEEEMAHVMTAVAVGLDAYALVGALEPDALGADILRPTRQFAADRQAMTVQEDAVGDGDVAAGRIRSGRIDLA